MLIGMMASKPNFLSLRPGYHYGTDNQLVAKFESEASGRRTNDHLPPAIEAYSRLPEANGRSSFGQRPRTRWRPWTPSPDKRFCHSIKRSRSSSSAMVTRDDEH